MRIERGVRDRWVHVLGVCGQRGRDGECDLWSVQHAERGVADDGVRGGVCDCWDEHVCELHDHGGTVCGWDDELRWELPGDGRGVFGRVWAVCPDGDGGVQPGWVCDDGVCERVPACDDAMSHVCGSVRCEHLLYGIECGVSVECADERVSHVCGCV